MASPLIGPSRRLTILLAALATGCDFAVPTSAPIIEQRWVLPADETTVSVAEILPADVQIVGGNFDVSVDPFAATRTLGEQCAACIPLDGLLAPAPAFAAAFTDTEPLPDDVVSVQLVAGAARVTIDNELSFDPIAGGGSITVSVRNGVGGPVLGQVSWSGATETIPAGSQRMKVLMLGTGTISGTLAVEASVVSVGGQLSVIDVSDRVTATVEPISILVSSATVRVLNEGVDFESTELDVEDVDEAITDHVERGAIEVRVQNPLGVSIEGQLVVTYPGGQVTKSISVPASPTSTVVVAYTGDELRSFLGKPGVTLAGSGVANAVGGTVSITPDQVMILDVRFDLTLRIGG